MGTELTSEAASAEELRAADELMGTVAPVPWLDAQTAGHLRWMIALLAERRSDAFAAILFGSVARHAARPLTDVAPSDVDVLVVFAPQPGQPTLSPEQHAAVSWAIIDALDAYPRALLEVQVTAMLAHGDGWDPSFIANVARDGVLLWQRGPLPEALRGIMRTAPA